MQGRGSMYTGSTRPKCAIIHKTLTVHVLVIPSHLLTSYWLAVELGPEFLHGSENNVLLDYIRNNGIKSRPDASTKV